MNAGRLPLACGSIALLLLVAVNDSLVGAAERTAAELLPGTVVVYAEVPQAKQLWATAFDSPLAREIAAHPDYQNARETPQFERFEAALAHFEQKLGKQWRPALDEITAGGVYAGFDLSTQGVAVLIHTADAETAAKTRDAIVELASAEAERQGERTPEVGEHRGVAAHKLGDVHLAAHEGWLIAANKSLLLRLILNNALDEPASLASDEQFRRLNEGKPADAAAWLYVDLRLLKLTGLLKSQLSKKSDNPGVELIAGGLLTATADASYVTASMTIDEQRLAIHVDLPCSLAEIAERKSFYFGREGAGAAPPLLQPKETLLTLSTYRDFASLWRSAPDLFNEEINAKFAEAESGLSTLFAGKNFRDDILGKLEPGLQLVVARQDFEGREIVPAIKLPAAGMVLRMKSPEETTRLFKVTFQSMIGFLNIAGGMNGVDPLDLNSEKLGNVILVSGEYFPPKDEKDRKAAPLQHNASPTAAFVGDRFILASTRSLALELAELVQHEAAASAETNTRLDTDGRVVRAALADNIEPLIAQNMLEKGHDRASAQKEMDGLLRALEYVDGSSLAITTAKDKVSLAWEIRLAAPKASKE